ncbi:MAG: protein BatD [Candidatus Aminicenantes bacterium]|nr:MAG: protein BatD [Candidatus Aminicenantes bacterium]
MMKKKSFLLLLALLVLTISVPVLLPGQPDRDVEVRASISADKIGIDDVLIYTFTCKNIDNPPQPDVFHFKNFKVVQTSQSSEFRFINGVTSRYTNFLFYLTPLKTGQLTIPAVTYKYEGEEYKTQSFTVEVVQGSLAKPKPQKRQPWPRFPDEDFSSPFERKPRRQEIDIKVIPEVSKKNVVVGEQTIFKVRLYTRNDIRSPRLISNQSIPGFWQEWYPLPQVFETETRVLGGKQYTTAEITKVALFPTKPGPITIPSLKYELGVVVSDSFSLFGTVRPIQRFTPEITVNVSPLPPAAAGLPVGQFQLQVTPNKKEVDINDILTLKIRITGKGNIKTLNVPEFKSSNYYKIYPAKISRDSTYHQDRLSGFTEAEVPVAFKKTGLISFPSLEFRYFDPDTSRVVALNNQPITVNVTGTKEKEASAVTIARTEIIKTGEDIDFIKNGNVYNQDNHFYTSKYFMVILLVPFLINVLFLLKVFGFDRFISESALIKQKKLINRTIKSLEKARNYGDISPILENYLQGRTGLGLSEINNHTIGQLLDKYGVRDGDIKAFIRVKSQSESYRFSPDKDAKASGKELKNDVKRLKEILKRIDSKVK